jgi:hypothetical protein
MLMSSWMNSTSGRMMSQQDNFSGGFLLGTVVGGLVGGLVGALIASGKLSELTAEDETLLSPEEKAAKAAQRRSLKFAGGQPDIEASRRSLEDKIAQLNEAIDDVREQLGGVNGTTPKSPISDRAFSKDN